MLYDQELFLLIMIIQCIIIIISTNIKKHNKNACFIYRLPNDHITTCTALTNSVDLDKPASSMDKQFWIYTFCHKVYQFILFSMHKVVSNYLYPVILSSNIEWLTIYT